jgi:Amt family ammonium transporter
MATVVATNAGEKHLKVVDVVVGLRVPAEQEIEGLDLSQHGEEGYNLEV